MLCMMIKSLWCNIHNCYSLCDLVTSTCTNSRWVDHIPSIKYTHALDTCKNDLNKNSQSPNWKITYPIDRRRKSGAKPRNIEFNRASISWGDFKGSRMATTASDQLVTWWRRGRPFFCSLYDVVTHTMPDAPKTSSTCSTMQKTSE